MARSLIVHGDGRYEYTSIRNVDLGAPVIQHWVLGKVLAKTSSDKDGATMQQRCSVKSTSHTHRIGRLKFPRFGYVQFTDGKGNRFAVEWVPAACKQDRTAQEQRTGKVLPKVSIKDRE